MSRLEGMVISKAPSKLRPKTKKTRAMKPFTQALEPSCTTPAGPSATVTMRPRLAEQEDDAEAESDGLTESALLPHEVRHRDRNHGEDAGSEDSGETEAEGEGQERGESAFGCAGCKMRPAGDWRGGRWFPFNIARWDGD